MWFENSEDKTAPQPNKTTTHPQDSGQPAEFPPRSGFGGSAFPGSSDPTKAFEEDQEEIGKQPATQDEISALKKAIKELEEKANLNYDRYLRALAEMENFKKRMNRERADLMRYAGEDLLLEILPVLDNLERTMTHATENVDPKRLVEGVSLVYKQFLKSLEKTGVARIEKAHCPFDPAIHQALQRVEDKSLPDDTVVEILQKGYTLNGKVVRPAMVKVAKH